MKFLMKLCNMCHPAFGQLVGCSTLLILTDLNPAVGYDDNKTCL